MNDKTTSPLAGLFDGDGRATPAPAAPAAAAPEPTPSNTDTQPRAADGRFAPKGDDGQAAPAAPAAPAAATPAPHTATITTPTPAADPLVSDGQGGMVPLSALLDERDKRQKAEARAEQLARSQTPAPAPPPRPDPEADPAGAAAYDAAHASAQFYNYRLQTSRKFAERQYGADVIKAAHEWANERCEPTSPNFDPYLNQQVAASDDPYELIMQAYNRDRVLQTVKPDQLAQFQQWLAAQENGGAPAPAAQPAPPVSPAAPPRSIVTTPSAGGPGNKVEQVDVGPGAAFKAAFSG